MNKHIDILLILLRTVLNRPPNGDQLERQSSCQLSGDYPFVTGYSCLLFVEVTSEIVLLSAGFPEQHHTTQPKQV